MKPFAALSGDTSRAGARRATPPSSGSGWRWLAGLAAAAWLSACGTVQPGMSQAQVIALRGQPTRVVALPSGTRLQYSLQPLGRQSTMVDLDASGRVVQVRQVLSANDFARIEVGRWTRADVEREFGPPAFVDRVASWPHDIMTYRWFEISDMFFWVYLDASNRVQRVGQGIEYHRDEDR